MTYQVQVGKSVRKAMRRFPRQDQSRIVTVLRTLGENPRPTGCQPVKAAEPGTYRVRVGNYRIVYTVLDAEQLIIVAKVARRGEDTYKRLT